MTDRPGQPTTGQPDAGKGSDLLRPIPDGGLAQAMPEWIRRKPAWETDDTWADSRDHAVPEAAPSSAPDGGSSPVPQRVPGRSQLIQPDTSPIDPASLITINDLPDWLQRVAARADRDVAADPAATVPAARASMKIVQDPAAGGAAVGASMTRQDQAIAVTPAGDPATGPVDVRVEAPRSPWRSIAGMLLILILVVLVVGGSLWIGSVWL